SCRCAAQQAVHHSGTRKRVALLQAGEVCPRQESIAATPRQPLLPDLPHGLPEFQEAEVIARDSEVRVVALQLLLERLVLDRDRFMAILATPLRQRLKRSLEAAPGRLAL